MTDYDNTNRGGLWKNARKESDKHPDYTGNINVNGVEMWLSAWIKTDRKGGKFMSLAVKPKDGDAGTTGRGEFGRRPLDTLDDDIPF